MRKKAFAAGLMAVCILSTLCSCGGQERRAEITDEGIVLYNTDDAPDANNYTAYVNKELTLVMNILRTHMTTAENIINGKALAADESKNLTGDIDLVEEAVESVETMNPPLDYEDDREAILTKLANALDTLTSYQEALDDGESDSLQNFIDLMESDYSALSGSFNILWE